jgi:hypothetical protein
LSLPGAGAAAAPAVLELKAADRRVRLRSDGSRPKVSEWQLTCFSTSRSCRFQGQRPGPFRRGATCGPSTGSVYGQVRWVSPVNAPTASETHCITTNFIAARYSARGWPLLTLPTRLCKAPCRAAAGAPLDWGLHRAGSCIGREPHSEGWARSD